MIWNTPHLHQGKAAVLPRGVSGYGVAASKVQAIYSVKVSGVGVTLVSFVPVFFIMVILHDQEAIDVVHACYHPVQNF